MSENTITSNTSELFTPFLNKTQEKVDNYKLIIEKLEKENEDLINQTINLAIQKSPFSTVQTNRDSIPINDILNNAKSVIENVFLDVTQRLSRPNTVDTSIKNEIEINSFEGELMELTTDHIIPTVEIIPLKPILKEKIMVYALHTVDNFVTDAVLNVVATSPPPTPVKNKSTTVSPNNKVISSPKEDKKSIEEKDEIEKKKRERIIKKKEKVRDDITEALWNGRGDGMYKSTEVEDKISLKLRKKGEDKDHKPHMVKRIVEAKLRTTSPLPKSLADLNKFSGKNINSDAPFTETYVKQAEENGEIRGETKARSLSPQNNEKKNSPTNKLNKSKSTPQPRFDTKYKPSSKLEFISGSFDGGVVSPDEAAVLLNKVYDGDFVLPAVKQDWAGSTTSIRLPMSLTPILADELVGLGTSIPLSRPKSSNLTDKDVEMLPVNSELINNIYDRPLVITILASTRRVSLNILIPKSCDPDNLIQPQLPLSPRQNQTPQLVPDKMMVKAYDPSRGIEASTTINMRECVAHLYSLRDKYSNDIVPFYQPASTKWWCDNIKKVLNVKEITGPAGRFCISLSKSCIERVAKCNLDKKEFCRPIEKPKQLTNFELIIKEENEKLKKESCSTPACRGEPRLLDKKRSPNSFPNPEKKQKNIEKRKPHLKPGVSNSNDSSLSKTIGDIKKKKDLNSTSKSLSSLPSNNNPESLTNLIIEEVDNENLSITSSQENSPVNFDSKMVLLQPVHMKDIINDKPLNRPGSPTNPLMLYPLKKYKKKMPHEEAVARSAIARARDHVSTDPKFRNRELSKVEIALFNSPFAQTFVHMVAYSDPHEKEEFDALWEAAEKNQFNADGKNCTTAEAHARRDGILVKKKHKDSDSGNNSKNSSRPSSSSKSRPSSSSKSRPNTSSSSRNHNINVSETI